MLLTIYLLYSCWRLYYYYKSVRKPEGNVVDMYNGVKSNLRVIQWQRNKNYNREQVIDDVKSFEYKWLDKYYWQNNF